MQQYAEYEKKYGKGSVALSDAMTEKDFAQDWGDMEGKPSEIVLNHHGTNQALHLNIDPDNNSKTKDGEYIVSTDSGKTSGSKTQGTKPEAPAVPATVLGQHTMKQTLVSSEDASTMGILTAAYVKNIEDNNWTKIPMECGLVLQMGIINIAILTDKPSIK